MSTFLTWAGGKSKLMHHITPHIPNTMHHYYEPFVGGGSILLYVLQQVEQGNMQVHGKFVCGDVNLPLILCYRAVKHSVDDVITSFNSLCNSYESCRDKKECTRKTGAICLCKECYYFAIRLLFNAHHQVIRVAADVDQMDMSMLCQFASFFLFLNSTCYRGLYRESKAGLMNSCYWTRRNIIRKYNELREAARLFRKFDVEFVATNFRQFLENNVQTPEGDPTSKSFIMFDPPYIPLLPSSHVSSDYHCEGFNDKDTSDLVDWIRTHKDTYHMTYCNHASDKLRDLFCQDEATWDTYKTFQVRHSMRYTGEAQVVMEMVVSTVG